MKSEKLNEAIDNGTLTKGQAVVEGAILISKLFYALLGLAIIGFFLAVIVVMIFQ